MSCEFLDRTPTVHGSEAVPSFAQTTTRSPPRLRSLTYNPAVTSSKLAISRVMSHTPPTTTSSPNFQLIFNNALRAYEKRTKNDLVAHPLAAQLQACDSPSAILGVLQQQVEDLNLSRSTGERWTKWLDPTVNVLFTLSATLGEGVSLVCLGS